MYKELKEIYMSKKMLKSLVINDFMTRYNGSALGIFWGFVTPVITILVYWFVFTVGLKSGGRPDGVPFILWMICGMIPWFYIAESILTMSTSFLDYAYLVKKVNFNIVLIPIIKLGSALLMHIFFLGISVLIFNLSGYYVNIYYVQLIYYIIAETFLVLGIGLLVSPIVVYYRDVAQMVGIFIQIGFWAIPIIWGTELLNDTFKFIFKLNPVYYIIEGYRESLLNGCFILNHPYQMMYFWIVSILIFFVGVKVFKKFSPNFSDVL